MIHPTAGRELENMFIVLAYCFINFFFFLGERKTESKMTPCKEVPPE